MDLNSLQPLIKYDLDLSLYQEGSSYWKFRAVSKYKLNTTYNLYELILSMHVSQGRDGALSQEPTPSIWANLGWLTESPPVRLQLSATTCLQHDADTARLALHPLKKDAQGPASDHTGPRPLSGLYSQNQDVLADCPCPHIW